MNKVGEILKAEKWKTRAKQVTIKEIEEKIVKWTAKLGDDSQFKYLIVKNDNEIVNLKNQQNIPTIHPVQTVEIHHVAKYKEKLLATVSKYTTWVEERDTKIRN